MRDDLRAGCGARHVDPRLDDRAVLAHNEGEQPVARSVQGEAVGLAHLIQETLNATNVGKLPDQNVAEAVRRLPGVSVANDHGEGRYVIIRGANPNLANVTVNGQTAPAPEPGRHRHADRVRPQGRVRQWPRRRWPQRAERQESV